MLALKFILKVPNLKYLIDEKLWSVAKHYISETFYKSILCSTNQFPIKLNILCKILHSIIKYTCQEISSLKKDGKYCTSTVFI